MKEIYLMQKNKNIFQVSIKELYLDDIYDIYPKKYKQELKGILIRNYFDKKKAYDVIHIGEIIEKINEKDDEFNITFLKPDDIVVYFDSEKKDRTKYLRVFITSLVIFTGSIMGIMNFHADVDMISSQSNLVYALTRDTKKYLPFFQIPYTIGIGIGVSLFFNKFIPTYSKYEPSPLDLRMSSLNKDIENQLKKK